MKKQRWLLSKWLYYSLFLSVLLVFVYLSLRIDALGRLFPTFIGLTATLGIFTMFFELREYLEWKGVADRVKRILGSEIHSIFLVLATLHNIESLLVFPQSEQDKLHHLSLLNDLIARKVSLRKQNSSFIHAFLEAEETHLREIDLRYGRFFDSKIQVSLMDIQNDLRTLDWALEPIVEQDETVREKNVSDVISKIMKEIANLRESGVDIGF